MELTAAEGRVLGCLVEKHLTTPQLYPLTDNALLAACNQTTNRDPVVSYDVATVRLAVRSLREKELVRTVHRTGERAEKHRHLLDTALELAPGEVALLAVLLLRGPQTPGELRARTERMHPFTSVEDVERTLEALVARGFATRLERQPGRKEARYADTLVSASAATAPVAGALYGVLSGTPAPLAAPEPPAAPGPPAGNVVALRAEVAELRAEVETLREELVSLRAEFSRWQR